MFKNRQQAGSLLAEKLKKYNGKGVVVLAIPRGGVVVGKEISKKLNCPLEILVIKKIGVPGNPELAAGAVGPDGKVVWNKELLQQLGLKQADMSGEVQGAKIKVQDYGAKFKVKNINLKDKTVILADDGIATGATMETAIFYLKSKKPRQIILAVPVASPEVIRGLEKMVGEVFILEEPQYLSAVGQSFEEFPQISDEEVVELLNERIK